MSVLFITYREGARLKKAKLTEEKLSALRSNPEVAELMVYPSETIMEKTYSTLTGSTDRKNMLLD